MFTDKREIISSETISCDFLKKNLKIVITNNFKVSKVKVILFSGIDLDISKIKKYMEQSLSKKVSSTGSHHSGMSI